MDASPASVRYLASLADERGVTPAYGEGDSQQDVSDEIEAMLSSKPSVNVDDAMLDALSAACTKFDEVSGNPAGTTNPDPAIDTELGCVSRRSVRIQTAKLNSASRQILQSQKLAALRERHGLEPREVQPNTPF
jgi:hypothetical protein